MSINLSKKQAIISLKKQNDYTKYANVILVLDTSGSMCSKYYLGEVFKAFTNILPIALELSPKKTLELFSFDRICAQHPNATEANYENYFKENNIHHNEETTDAINMVNALCKYRAIKKQSKPDKNKILNFIRTQFQNFLDKIRINFATATTLENKENNIDENLTTLVLILTDGDFDHVQETYSRMAQAENIFWNIIFVQDKAVMQDCKDYENIDSHNLNFEELSKEEVYSTLLQKFFKFESTII